MNETRNFLWIDTSNLSLFTFQVSKQRPSNRQSKEAGRSGMTRWRCKIFKNSYTRNGQRIHLNDWSVKIQVGGKRHTFRLTAQTKAKAAIEAKTIYETICHEGWESAFNQFKRQNRRGENFFKNDSRYWRERLLLRRYRFPGSNEADQNWAASIDHTGGRHIFLLGTADAEAAAQQAQNIYQTIAEQGWSTGFANFSRELIVGLEWCANPILWTYTTIHTLTKPESNKSICKTSEDAIRIMLVESDEATRRALTWCIEQQAMICKSVDGAVESLERLIELHKPQVIFMNRNLAGRLGIHFAGQIAVIKDVLVLTYSVYSEGNHMFVSTPGGAESYLLKRVAPDHLLDPILKLGRWSGISNENLVLRIRSYFEGLYQSHHHSDVSDLAKLTRREREVLALLSKGHVDKEIAQALGISAWTVHGHIKNIFERLNVRTRTEAVVRYLEK
ncbi:MAG TPA: response regulator transcription factor [Verrucomicrobiae bacterium]|nr:response regulator transcription factor [Verrucomicrobiae bacterium]